MKIRIFILLLLSSFVFTACSTVRGFLIENQAPEKVADVIDSWCEEIPKANREETRAAINAETTNGNSVVITCGNDTP